MAQKPLSSAQAFAYDPLKVLGYFNDLRDTTNKYGKTPQNSRNIDETGFRIGIGGKGRVVVSALQKHKNHYVASESDCESMILTEYINNAGPVIPPMIVAACKNMFSKFARNTLLDGTPFDTSDCTSLSRASIQCYVVYIPWYRRCNWDP